MSSTATSQHDISMIRWSNWYSCQFKNIFVVFLTKLENCWRLHTGIRYWATILQVRFLRGQETEFRLIKQKSKIKRTGQVNYWLWQKHLKGHCHFRQKQFFATSLNSWKPTKHQTVRKMRLHGLEWWVRKGLQHESVGWLQNLCESRSTICLPLGE